ncbi:MAG: type II toxin-antitoxin system RelE/ParE family toxin [Pseudomonadales bacterium]
MIRSFKDRKTQRFFEGQRIRNFQGFVDQATRRLAVLDSAESLQDLSALRSNRLESLSGDRAGQYSIRINQRWRLCFRWEDDGPYDVQIVDYHR